MAVYNSLVRRQITLQVSPQTVTRITVRTRGPPLSQDVVRLVPTPSLLTTSADTRMLDCQGFPGSTAASLMATDSSTGAVLRPGKYY
jgi:hypothetical protein